MFTTFSVRTLLVLVASVAPSVLAQTFTSCNPLNSTNCPKDLALGRSNYSIDFTTSTMTSTVWNTTAGTINYGDNGAEFTIAQRGDAPTVQTNFYLFFGQVEVIMKAASGQGIISSIVLESDDLDEVDWELMGGNTTHAETNYFGKGNTTSYDRAIYYALETPQETWHNYTVDWSADKIDWYVDSNIVRTLNYEDANGGSNFPQTPMNVRLGIWAGGDPKEPNGTIEWAGGPTDYSHAPFTMQVKSVRVSDASRGTEYQYGDTSGSWQSIKVLNDTAPVKLDGNNGASTQNVKQKWTTLSSTGKIIVASSVAGILLIAIAVLTFCCIKQRRIGRKERELEDAAFEKNAAELMAYRSQMVAQQQQKPSRMQAVRNSWNEMTGQRGYQRF